MTDEQQQTEAPAAPSEGAQGTKLLIELAPLLIFFGTYWAFGIYPATAALMASTVASLIASRLLLGKMSPMLIVTAVVVCLVGGLTFWLNDPSFIKMKPTFVNLLFAGALGAGLMLDKPLIKLLFGEQLQLADEGWFKLTVRWMLFFVAMAVVNELVWRNFSESTWVSFKVFGLLPLSLAFALAQINLIRRYQLGS
ncbi:MAG: septation protein A [Hyphomicrobium sp.]